MLDFIRLKCVSRVQTQNEPSFAAGWAASGLMHLYTDPLTCLRLPASSSHSQLQIFYFSLSVSSGASDLGEVLLRVWKYTGNLNKNTLPTEVTVPTPEKERMDHIT